MMGNDVPTTGTKSVGDKDLITIDDMLPWNFAQFSNLITGYDVYCDGVKIIDNATVNPGDGSMAPQTYDLNFTKGQTYKFSTVFHYIDFEGSTYGLDSKISYEVAWTPDFTTSISDVENSDINIAVADGVLSVSGAKAVQVFSALGVLCGAFYGDIELTLNPDMYIVKADDKTKKVVV